MHKSRRRSEPHIGENKGSATSPFYIHCRVEGKRVRKYFGSRREAEQELMRMKTKLAREGEDALSIPDQLRIAAIAIQSELDREFPGKTLADAGKFYLKYLRETVNSISVSGLVTEYLSMQKRLGRSAVHITDLTNRYAIFAESFGDEPVRTLEIKVLEAWLHGLKLSAQSVNNYRSRLGGLFSYGVKRGYMDKNPIDAIGKIKVVDKAPEILTPDQLARLLEAAPADLLPLLVIGAFAGIRTGELVRLEWDGIDFVRGFLNVGAAKAKTAKRRLIRMEPALVAWLAPFAGRTGKIFSGSDTDFCHRMNAISKAAGIAKWPKNGLRHSFASYHLAKHLDASRLALDLGHTSTKLIFANYREVVTPEEAERYFALRPPTQAENVISLAAAS